jgi:hypothetical protein
MRVVWLLWWCERTASDDLHRSIPTDATPRAVGKTRWVVLTGVGGAEMVCRAWARCAAVATAGRGGVPGRECMRALVGGVGLLQRAPAPGVDDRDTAYRAAAAGGGNGITSDMRTQNDALVGWML